MYVQRLKGVTAAAEHPALPPRTSTLQDHQHARASSPVCGAVCRPGDSKCTFRDEGFGMH
eukprot:scaffold269976_cov31-Tisochrysis_lutea.AAC.2